MTPRAEIILESIINHFVSTAEPVGSRVLSKILIEKMSPATIRNIMSDLTELKLIEQPHTSAGRIPTDKGYRYYVDKLRKKPAEDSVGLKSTSLESEERNYTSLDNLLLNAIRELNGLTDFMAVITSPQPALSKLKKIEFIRLSQTQVLVIMITQTGLVRNKIIYFRECPVQENLNKMCKILEKRFEGVSIFNIRSKLIETFSDDFEEDDHLLAQAIRLGKKAFDLNTKSELYSHGFSKICLIPEFRDYEELEGFYRLFEDETSLVNILENTMDHEGLQVKIGYENHFDGLEHCSLVASTYGNQDQILGTVGVIGPTRMNYSKVFSAVDHTQQKLSCAVSRFLDRSE